MALLTRNADRLYWSARYVERAEDTSRLVLRFGELFDDLPASVGGPERWGALLAVFGPVDGPDGPIDRSDERAVVHAIVSDTDQPGSVRNSVRAARANLRTCRELLPREAWSAVNDLWRFVEDEVGRSDDRRFRQRVLRRVIDESRRLDGVLQTTMSRDDAFEMWRIGRFLERADMTTRVVGVRAAGLLTQTSTIEYDAVQWMGVLRSLSALQMYQRTIRGPIDASAVVRFLLFDEAFPRSVRFCLNEVGRGLDQLADSETAGVRAALDRAVDDLGSTSANVTDGVDLDGAMDRVQQALGTFGQEFSERFLKVPER